MNRSRVFGGLATAGGCLLLSACSTIKSKIYDYDNYSDGRQVKCLKGIPETLDVPTHVQVTVTETRYFKGPKGKAVTPDLQPAPVSPLPTPAPAPAPMPMTGGSARAGGTELIQAQATATEQPMTVDQMKARLAKLQAELEALVNDAKRSSDFLDLPERVKALKDEIEKLKARITAAAPPALSDAGKFSRVDKVCATRAVLYEVITRKELYTVDFKRPLSGTNDVKIAYGTQSSGQFFKSVKQDLTDTSIQDVANLVSQVSAVLPKLKAISDTAKAEEAGVQKLGLHAITTVVAVEYFDVREPHLEARIQEFLERHVNACSDRCEPGGSCPVGVPATAVPAVRVPAPVTDPRAHVMK
jgi:hypothetical protein